MNAELVRFRPWQRLVNGEQAFKVSGRNPFFFGHQFLPDHVDLRHRPPPGKRTKA